MKTRVLTFSLWLNLGIIIAIGQDAEFTQFYANPVYLNPAFAGSAKCPRIALNYRNQWPGIKEGFQTYSASYDQYVNVLSGGLGLQLLKDGSAAEAYSSTSANATYAYHLVLSRKLSLSAGIRAGYFQRSINLDELIFPDQLDETNGVVRNSREAIGTNSKSGADFSAGVLVYNKRFFAGAAVHHLNEPRIGLITHSRLQRRYTLHAGMHIPLDNGESSNISISPNLLFTSQGSFSQINAGLYITKGIITGGLWYRNKDAMIVLLGIDDKRYKFGYSYDITLSGLRSASGGAHELSFAYRLPCQPKKIKYKGEKCKVQPGSEKKRKFSRVECPSF